MLCESGHQPGDKIKVVHGERKFTVEIPAGVYEVCTCQTRSNCDRAIQHSFVRMTILVQIQICKGQTFEVRFNISSPVSKHESIQHAG